MNEIAWILAASPLALGAYTYALYPLLLRMTTRGVVTTTVADDLELPVVTIVVPAYNEERQIRGVIEALLAQDYPADRMQVLILSDASTDRTDEVVAEFAARGVELLRMPVRGGKTAAENASCALLRGDIVVNTDSSIRFHPSTVRLLVQGMRDPRVGVASGRDVSVSAAQLAGANAAEAGYVGYEMWVRALETRHGGIVGASGSGYAIRRELHQVPVRDDLSRDFSAALVAHRHGYIAVSVDEALCQVPRTASLKREYRRKVRTISRGMETLYHQRDLLDPTRHGAFAWKLLSHKVCRWLLPLTAVLSLLGFAMLSASHSWAWVAIAGAALLVAAALVGAGWPDGKPMPRLLSIASFGVAANVAVLHAMLRMAAGHHDHIWEPTRR